MSDGPEQTPSPVEGSMTASSSSSTSPDNFTVLNKLPCMMSSTSKSQFNQVIFHDLQELYPCDSDIRCTYSLTEDIHPQPGDKVSLFKVGWHSVSEYISFVRPNADLTDGRIKHVTIPAADIPKDPGDSLYQLCYISSGNVVAGASIPFSFHKPHESELVAVEDPNDPGLVVFRSRAGQLQDQLHLKTQQCEELMLECELKNEKLDILRKKLEESDAKVATIEKELEELREGRNAHINNQQVLENSLKKCREQEETINHLEFCLNEMQELVSQKQKQLCKADEESYKVQEYVTQLRSMNDSLQQEVNQATQSAQELKAELQVKQLALANSMNDNERLEKQNAEWELKLKQAVLLQNKAVSDKLETEDELAKAENVIRELSQKVQETRAFIQDIQTSGPEDERQAKMIDLEDRLLVSNIQLQDLKDVHNSCAAQILELREELQRTKQDHELEVVQLVSEKVDCQEKIQSLLLESKNERKSSFEPMKDLYDALARNWPSLNKPSTSTQAGTQDEGRDEELESRIKKIVQKKMELQEELVRARHERDEINSCLKNSTEENASLKSRISVLEVELAAIKTDAGVYKSGGSSNIASALEAFNKNVVAIEKFNQTVEECKLWKSKFDSQKEETLTLQKKVEDLLLKDGQMCDELARIKRGTGDRQSIEDEYFQMMTNVVGDMTRDMDNLKNNYETEKKERMNLEQQLIEARKALVGKVSVESSQRILEENAQFRAQFVDEKRVSGCLKNFVFSMFENDNKGPILCPLCPTVCPRTESESFIAHFTSHVD